MRLEGEFIGDRWREYAIRPSRFRSQYTLLLGMRNITLSSRFKTDRLTSCPALVRVPDSTPSPSGSSRRQHMLDGSSRRRYPENPFQELPSLASISVSTRSW